MRLRDLSDWQLEVAISWLRCNEGEDGEDDACSRVASYLEGKLGCREELRVRSVARKHGVDVEHARDAVRRWKLRHMGENTERGR